MRNDGQKILIEFLHFLKSKNVLRTYLFRLKSQPAKNYRWIRNEHTNEDVFLALTALYKPEFLLKNAFDWSHLRGDDVYVWRNLHNCWITKLEYLKKDEYDIWRYRKTNA